MVSSISMRNTRDGSPIEEALQHSDTPIPDRVAFKIDLTNWLLALTALKRQIATEMITGERTGDLAQRHRVSPGRISQFRGEFLDSWEAFTGG